MTDSSSKMTQGVLAAAAVIAYLTSPLLTYIDPGKASAYGTVLAAGILIHWAEYDGNKGWRILGLIMATSGVFALAFEFNQAAHHYEDVQEVCLSIEGQMLGGQSTRNDLPAVFQALDCPVAGSTDLGLQSVG